MTDQAADAAVDQACRMLQVLTMRARFAEIADAAQRERLTYRGCLAELMMAALPRATGSGGPWRADGVTGFDLTFSSPKSLSALWALGSAEMPPPR